jgi:hypothetical protein
LPLVSASVGSWTGKSTSVPIRLFMSLEKVRTGGWLPAARPRTRTAAPVRSRPHSYPLAPQWWSGPIVSIRSRCSPRSSGRWPRESNGRGRRPRTPPRSPCMPKGAGETANCFKKFSICPISCSPCFISCRDCSGEYSGLIDRYSRHTMLLLLVFIAGLRRLPTRYLRCLTGDRAYLIYPPAKCSPPLYTDP